MLTLLVRRVAGADDLPLPARRTPSSAGLDLSARAFVVDGVERDRISLAPGERALVKVGVALALPAGHVGLVCPRSGLALAHGVGVVNGPGVLDEDYRGEVGVLLINHGAAKVELSRGERVAQLVVLPAPLVEAREVDSLDETRRGDGGFGSTGRGG
ncbi:MAG: dUTP diphosphatase [Polyangiaceae bacterium]|nr:dUTP diphosphatase [Polyangiaceae bacterium]